MVIWVVVKIGITTKTPKKPVSLRIPKQGKKIARALANPVLSGTITPPPNTNTGWSAQQFVMLALQGNGWVTHDVSRQQLGYDLLAKKGRQTRFIEVKSSIGACSPTLTAREWEQAKQHSSEYILAIIENFNLEDRNTIYWIQDPVGCCVFTQHTTINYSIPRASWSEASVPLDAI